MDHQQLIEALPVFTVASAGASDAVAPLAVRSAAQSFPLLARLVADVAGPLLEPVPVESFLHTEAARASAARLKELFDHHGSDKASPHAYHHLYGSLLQSPPLVTAVFEVGLGTNNEDVVSHMGAGGRPGASLRAFRDFLPNAAVYGADVDRRVLFSDDRIETFHVDQLDPASFDRLPDSLPREFDLVIDDGLHSPGANLATLCFALGRLKPGGVLVIEDVQPAHFPVWQVVAALLPAARYQCFLALATHGALFVVQRGA
jgi:SAM-dependent methyltransferase